MEKQRFLLFIALSLLIFFGWGELMRRMYPPAPRPAPAQRDKDNDDKDNDRDDDDDEAYVAKVFAHIETRQVRVDTEKFQTNIPGIFAVGDINSYPGKKKLILSGFHEAALAAFAVQQHIHPEQKVRLQYTTTSPIMHKRLGVED